MNYEKEMLVSLRAASIAGELIKHHYLHGATARIKSDSTPVTEADIQSNKLIVDMLSQYFPDDGIVSEELGMSGAGKMRVWHVDPLDGTKSFVQRADAFGIHIGLAVEGNAVLGVVHKPLTGESYQGIVGEGAYRLPEGIHTKPSEMMALDCTRTLDGLIGVIENRQKSYDSNKELFQKIGVTGYLLTGSEGLRAMKIVDGLAHFRLGSELSHSWDACAPHAIVQAAGGIVEYARLNEPIIYSGHEMKDMILYAKDKKTYDLIRNSLA